jgi:hypothetical protein
MAFLVPEIAEVAEAGAAEAGAAESTEAAESLDEQAPHGEHDLGNGNSMSMSPEQFKAFMHSPQVVAAIMDRANKCADIADSLAITKGAEYGVSLQNDPSHTRARAAVYAANFKAVVDELNHSTLLKAAAQTGSDPRESISPEDLARKATDRDLHRLAANRETHHEDARFYESVSRMLTGKQAPTVYEETAATLAPESD